MAEDDSAVEVFTRFGAITDTMTDAFAFVMEYMDKAGPHPSVEINACHGESDPPVFQHYHVAVFGVINEITN